MAGLRKRVTGLMVREVEGEILVLDTETDRIHKLNPTASFIWRMCDEVSSPEEIAKFLANEFEVEEHQALSDVTDTLGKLRVIGVLD